MGQKCPGSFVVAVARDDLEPPAAIVQHQRVAPAAHHLGRDVSHVVRVRSSIRLYLSELGLTPASRDRNLPKLTALGRDLERQEHDRFFGPR